MKVLCVEGTWVVRTKGEIDPQVTYSGCRSLVYLQVFIFLPFLFWVSLIDEVPQQQSALPTRITVKEIKIKRICYFGIVENGERKEDTLKRKQKKKNMERAGKSA